MAQNRQATVNRKTKETDITLALDIDGEGKAEVSTGIGFLDHMLEGFAKHGFFNLKLQCKGDLYVDGHHTAEDCGIVLGTAIKQAVGDKAGIKRYGSFTLPMDDALVTCGVDLCGRPYLNYGLKIDVPSIGYLQTELIKEFFYAVSYTAG
ncbi:MAG: imidazoleglycerol-phosphate dehydratase, partial [Lachnospiraceae bacterium]|nr:imidazoleglycerol-phosphate dehydratase [Lachnospiraceae bacterium]